MNSVVTTAVVLAGGLGTRLRSVVKDVPKPMAPVHEKPFLAYVLDYWISQGIKRFVLSIGYLSHCITQYFGEAYRGARIDYVIEDKPLGPGGAVLNILEKMQPTSPLLLLNGDTYFTVSLNKLCQFAVANQADLVFSLFNTEENNRYMIMDIDTHGRILSMPSVPRSHHQQLANGGVYWVGPGAAELMLQKCPTNSVSLDEDVFPTLFLAHARMYGMVSKAPFIDIGLPEDYAQFQEQMVE